ncbi:MAG: nucleoside-diphosphate-sugar epimerase [Paraglaciecola sp.]
MKSQNQISILGCGWLGMPLAKQLSSEGYSVIGSTTQVEKLKIIKQQGAQCVLLNLKNFDAIPSQFFESDIWIITIPPFGEPNEFYTYNNLLAQKIIDKSPQQIIVTSSISVYPDLGRKVVERDAAYDQLTRTGISLLRYEDQLWSDHTTVLRLGGLIGPNRHPIKHFTGKTGLPGGKNPINLIHLDDCIKSITSVISNKIVGQRLNLCSPYHPEKSTYYREVARRNHLALPVFDQKMTAHKIVSSDQFIDLLGYSFVNKFLL